jgi:cyclic pyranopterin phosphate synthase
LPYRDDFGRAINYLRVSVTDRCNLRCIYCMPIEGVEKQIHSEILRYEELALIVRAAAQLGIGKVRLTGGEPLARLGLTEFVRMIASTPGIDDLSMTTNGTLLARHATALAEAADHPSRSPPGCLGGDCGCPGCWPDPHQVQHGRYSRTQRR